MLIPDMPKVLEPAPYVFRCKHDPIKKFRFNHFVKPLNEVIVRIGKDKEWCNDYRIRDELIIELIQIKNKLIEIYDLHEYEKPTILTDNRFDF